MILLFGQKFGVKTVTAVLIVIQHLKRHLKHGTKEQMKINDIELKPCPFCGSEDLYDDEMNNWVSIVCNECSGTSGCYNGLDLAIETWNKRI
jgi:Lar family restriction alleviation protein